VTDVLEHLIGTGPLIVAFASEDMKQFQWGRALSRLGVPHVLVRDSLRRWYQDGAFPHAGRDTLVSYIRGFRLRGHRVITLGASAGAYGALMYGKLAEVDRIIAVSPVTGIYGEDFPERWRHRFVRSPGDPEVEDLRGLFAQGSWVETAAYATDGPDCELDGYMADRIGVPTVVIPGYDHATLARGMRDNGTIERLLRA
jgi:hypothetical protein